jgi:DNA-binding MarR family transcriptional regulator
MYRDVDPRPDEPERDDLSRGSRGGSDESRPSPADDPRDVFSRDLDLPRGPTRERVVVRSHAYTLRGSEVRTLATAGAFRVVRAEELRRPGDRPTVLDKDLDRLRDRGLVRTMPYVVGRERTRLVTLTDQGREVLEAARRPRDGERPQEFYAGIAKSRELSHDVRVHSAYRQASERLIADGNRVTRAVLDYELKREYQAFLQAPNRGRRNSSGRPQRDAAEIARWAQEHQLPMVDDRVQFPDVRIEYERPDGRRDIEDVEVMTPHYRGAHAASKVKAGFTRYGSTGARVGGRGSTRGGRGRESRLAEEMLG